MLEIGAFDSRNDFNTQIYCSTHFYIYVSKHKSLYFLLTFSQNQFYTINSLKLIFCQPRTKHAHSVWQCLEQGYLRGKNTQGKKYLMLLKRRWFWPLLRCA